MFVARSKTNSTYSRSPQILQRRSIVTIWTSGPIKRGDNKHNQLQSVMMFAQIVGMEDISDFILCGPEVDL